MKNVVDKLVKTQNANDEELLKLIRGECDESYLFAAADSVKKRHYGTAVYIRGLIEISNRCKNDCYYCGIRKSNKNAVRYRLSESEILSCCENGYRLGFRTFVLQGGEDSYYTDEVMSGLISEIKSRYPSCAVTLSLGERSYESYKKMYDSGADRYLLRHETANDEHYKKLHPKEMSGEKRKQCLRNLKEIGYQVGSGFMVGSPYQSDNDLLSDLRFLQELKPHMIGIGPFIVHKETPFGVFSSGELTKTLRMVALLRLMFPEALIPSTTALGSIAPDGRERGLKAGANVVMPNLSPVDTRKLYDLYENKICTEEESAECLECLKKRVESIGCEIVVARGDAKNIENRTE